MKKVFILILILILSFVGFKYWEKTSDRINNPPIQTSTNKSLINGKSIPKKNKKSPCFEAAISFLTIKEIMKQDSELCGQQKRFEHYSDSELVSTVSGVSMKCLIDEGVNNGFTTAEAKIYTEMYIAEEVSKLKEDKVNKDKNKTCNTLNAVLTAYRS